MLIYDLEIFPNLFIGVFYHYKIKKITIFEISYRKDEREALFAFIRKNKNVFFVGYNNSGFDDPLLYHMFINPTQTIQEYKAAANKIIESVWCPYPSWDVQRVIPRSIDLMSVNNYGRFGKGVSLKQLEFNFRRPSIKDLPFKHYNNVNTDTNIAKVISYCELDVDVTREHFDISKPLLRYRRDFGKLIGIDIITDSEVTLAKKTIIKIFSDKMGMDPKDFKKLRTYPDRIKVSDVLVNPKFTYQKHKDLFDFYNKLDLLPTVLSKVDFRKKAEQRCINLKNVINYKVSYPSGLETVYGFGGIHGCVKAGVYKEDDDYMLWDWDWNSWYPHLIDRLGLDPRHLRKGLLGNQLMTWYHERMTKYPKKTHFGLNYAIKIIINLLFGQMNSEYGPLYDPQQSLATCVNGMLFLTKMTELVMIGGGEVLYQNTDGILIKIKRSEEARFKKILDDYALELDIPIESVKIKKLILHDVNNFITVDEDDNVKEKGDFITYETLLKEASYHKDFSALIIPKALHNYFIKGISVEDTINNANDIYDFCYGVKGGSTFELTTSIEGGMTFVESKERDEKGEWSYTMVEQKVKNGIIVNDMHDVRMLRYYPSNTGSTLTKLWKEESKKGKKQGISFDSVEANTTVRLLQTIRKKDIHDILKSGKRKLRYDKNNEVIERFPDLDRQWFIDKCYKIINKIEI